MMIGVPVVTDLMVGLGLMTIGALLLPFSARWIEHSYPNEEAFLVSSMVGVALTAVFSGGIAGFLAVAFQVEGGVRVAVLGIGSVLAITMIVACWRLLRKSRKKHGFEHANGVAGSLSHGA